MKIAVGLSGGVDSSVALYLLKDKGYDIFGLTMRVCDSSKYPEAKGKSACFGGDEEDDIEDARKVADYVGVPFHVIDLADEYEKRIIGYFREEYKNGRTPNPCVRCNREMKFGLLLDEAKRHGIQFDCFATGHYVRVEKGDDGLFRLKKARYLEKDQSYFLSLLNQEQLAHVMFPLGDLTKEEVRTIASKIGLFTSDKPESQDFYSGDIHDLLDKNIPAGNIVDQTGKILGKHEGISHYTIGQRKGLKISSDKPLYVTGINKDTNQVIVDSENGLYKSELIATGFNWSLGMPDENSFRANGRIRYRHTESPAAVTIKGPNEIHVRFDTPQRAITPGQILALYDGDTVIGGGIIDQILS